MTYLKISNEYEQSNKKPSNFDKQLSLGDKIEHDSKTRDSPQEELTDENKAERATGDRCEWQVPEAERKQLYRAQHAQTSEEQSVAKSSQSHKTHSTTRFAAQQSSTTQHHDIRPFQWLPTRNKKMY